MEMQQALLQQAAAAAAGGADMQALQQAAAAAGGTDMQQIAALQQAAAATPAMPDLSQLLLHQQMLQAQQQQLLAQGLQTPALEIQKQLEQLQAMSVQLQPVGTEAASPLAAAFHNFNQFSALQAAAAQTQAAPATNLLSLVAAVTASGGDLAERVKAVQRASAEGKQAWVAYCEQQGTGYFDPGRHDNAFLQGFLDSVGLGAAAVAAATAGVGDKGKGEKGKGKCKGKPKGMGPPEPIDAPDVEQHKVFVASLPRNVTEEQLKEYFGQYGEVSEVRLKYDPNDGSFRGFAFVTFNDKADARRILENYDNNYFDGKWIACVPVKMRPGKGGSGPAGRQVQDTEGLSLDKIFVSGLPPSTTEESLKAHFECFGSVQHVRLMYNQGDGSFRGFAFVTFDEEESGKNVILNFEDNIFDGKWIECQAARPKDDEFMFKGGCGGCKGKSDIIGMSDGGCFGGEAWNWSKGCGKMDMMTMMSQMMMKGKMAAKSKMKGMWAGKGDGCGKNGCGAGKDAPGGADAFGGSSEDGCGGKDSTFGGCWGAGKAGKGSSFGQMGGCDGWGMGANGCCGWGKGKPPMMKGPNDWKGGWGGGDGGMKRPADDGDAFAKRPRMGE
mmetsp:Transcript_11484/g.26588  ORF Transcript_11484/g.26588 Transcript_11484/m.26588 type:complete len:611 (-) Transcript_11484:35-1867(-)